jgi:hypothetical protein
MAADIDSALYDMMPLSREEKYGQEIYLVTDKIDDELVGAQPK